MAAISSGIFAGAMLSQVVTAGAAIAGAGAAVAGTALSAAKSSKAPAQTPAPTFNAEAEKKKIANQEAEANRKRILAESDTVKTSALGNTGTTETKKKTLLGG